MVVAEGRRSGNAWELVAVVGLARLCGIERIDAMLYPPVTGDEALFADPAVNLATGNGFRSSVWYTQPYGSVFASNAPLYPLVLSLWIRLTGFTPVAVRAMNYLFMAVAAFFLWFSVKRMRLIASAGNRLLFFCAILFGEGIAFAYRMGRYDALGLLIASMIWTVAVAWPEPWPCRTAFFLGGLLALSGLMRHVHDSVRRFAVVVHRVTKGSVHRTSVGWASPVA
jgi:hypothetical protein